MDRIRERIALAVESYLIKLNEWASDKDLTRVIAFIVEKGGRIQSVIQGSFAIIAVFENHLADEVRRLPSVKLVGGVTLKDKKIPIVKKLQR